MRRLFPVLFLLGCPPSSDDKETSGTDDTADSGDTATGDLICEEPVEPTCVDDMILDLSLHEGKMAEGGVTNTKDGDDWVTDVDATGGGYDVYLNSAWVYLRFTDAGAEKVEITDGAALEDMGWDMSLRRYILRLNGGDSGPSCVGAAAMFGYTYDELSMIPGGVGYQLDDYYTDDCTFINDSSGLEGSPQVAMSSWWSYPGCVATSGTPFLLRQQNGRVLKLVVTRYYDEGQEDCNKTGRATGSGGYIQFRWRYL